MNLVTTKHWQKNLVNEDTTRFLKTNYKHYKLSFRQIPLSHLQATAYVHIRIRKIVNASGMALLRFTVEAVTRDNHTYKSIWLNPVMKEELSCEWEIGNAQDAHTVGMHKTIGDDVKTVRHTPCNIAFICSIL